MGDLGDFFCLIIGSTRLSSSPSDVSKFRRNHQPQPTPTNPNHQVIICWLVLEPSPGFFPFLGSPWRVGNHRRKLHFSHLSRSFAKGCSSGPPSCLGMSWHVLAPMRTSGEVPYDGWYECWYIHPCYISLFPMINHYWRSYYTVTTSKYRDFLIYKTCILDYLREGFLGPPSHLNIRNPICLNIHCNIRMELVFHNIYIKLLKCRYDNPCEPWVSPLGHLSLPSLPLSSLSLGRHWPRHTLRQSQAWLSSQRTHPKQGLPQMGV